MNDSGGSEWDETKQRKYEDAITAQIEIRGRDLTEDERHELWNIIAFPELHEETQDLSD